MYRQKLYVRCFAALILGSLAVSSCNFEGDPVIAITYVNNTDSLLCLYYVTPEILEDYADAELGCPAAVPPLKTTTWGSGCDFGLDDSGIAIALVEDTTRRTVYERAASCREWMDAGSTLTIDRTGDSFVVVDGFPDVTPEPAPN